MSEQLCRLAIARIPLVLHCDSPLLAASLRQRYSAFASTEEPSFHVQVAWQATTGQQDGACLPVASPYAFTFEQGKLSFCAPDYRGEVDIATARAWLSLRVQSPLEGVEYFLRVIYALLLFDAGGILLHAAGLVRGQRAYVFFGHSGSGKTTVSRLSTDVIVLNDDLVALLPVPGGWMVHATPFWNPSQVKPAPYEAPLAGLYRLVQDRRVWVEQISPAQAVAELASSIPVISADASHSECLMARCVRLVAEVGVKRLHFLKDDTFWDVL